MRKIAYISLLVTGLTLSACSEDNYAPGADITATCQQVYFSNENQSEAILPASDTSQRTITLQVLREKTDLGITVPVKVISASEGLVIQPTITFEANASVAELTIDVPENAQNSDSYTYQIELEGENTDPYSELPGSLRFFGSIMIADIIQATACLGSGQGGTFNVIVEKTGENSYRISDFFGSGHALDFTVDLATGNITINCDYGYQSGVNWWFYDKNAGAYLPFGYIMTRIQGIYNGAGYTFWKEEERTAQFYLQGVTYEDGGSADWEPFILEW